MRISYWSSAVCSSDLDARDVVLKRRAADLHLHHLVAHAAVAAHLLLQSRVVLAWVVVAAGCVDEDAVVHGAVAFGVGEMAVERHAGDLGDGITHRHVDDPDGDRAPAVAASLLVGLHGGPAPSRAAVSAGLV